MEHAINQAIVRGYLDAPVELSHESHGKHFLRFQLNVPRLSGNVDTVPVIAEQHALLQSDLSVGTELLCVGQIRSRNIRLENGRHLCVFLFAQQVEADDGEPMNEVTVCGTLCREPVYRMTPLGREICDGMLAVPRSFHRADYLPCIFWGSTAQSAACCHTGDPVLIHGRIQSRNYTKLTDDGPQQRTAYEISSLNAQFGQEIEDESQNNT